MMFAVLGELEIEVIACQGLDLRAGANYAEHALIGRRPTLQWLGDTLEERRLDVAFFDSWGDPVLQANRLRQALRDHQSLALVLGSGTHCGWFVITEIQETPVFSRPVGDPRALRLAVTLREFAGDPAKPVERPALRVDPLTAVTGGATGWVDAINGAIREAAQFAAMVQGYLSQAMSLAQFALLVADDPLAALSLAPQLLSGLSTLGLPLASLTGLLSGVGAFLDSAELVADLGAEMLAGVNAIIPLLGADLTALNVADRLASIAGYLDSAADQWAAVAALPASTWAATAAIRGSS